MSSSVYLEVYDKLSELDYLGFQKHSKPFLSVNSIELIANIFSRRIIHYLFLNNIGLNNENLFKLIDDIYLNIYNKYYKKSIKIKNYNYVELYNELLKYVNNYDHVFINKKIFLKYCCEYSYYLIKYCDSLEIKYFIYNIIYLFGLKYNTAKDIVNISLLKIRKKQLFLYDDNYLYRKGKKFLNYLIKNKSIENKLLYDLFENLSTTKIGELLLLYDDITINFPKM